MKFLLMVVSSPCFNIIFFGGIVIEVKTGGVIVNPN